MPRCRRPTRLLVRSEFGIPERGAFERVVVRLQSAWLDLSGAERIERIEGAGHYIQEDRPEAVRRAIEDSVRDTRRAAGAGAPEFRLMPAGGAG